MTRRKPNIRDATNRPPSPEGSEVNAMCLRQCEEENLPSLPARTRTDRGENTSEPTQQATRPDEVGTAKRLHKSDRGLGEVKVIHMASGVHEIHH